MDSLFRAYAKEAIRSGEIDPDTINRAADEAEAEGDPMTAHHLRLLIIEADGRRATEIEADKRRGSLRVV